MVIRCLSAERRDRAEPAPASPGDGVPSEARPSSAIPANTMFTTEVRSSRKASICTHSLAVYCTRTVTYSTLDGWMNGFGRKRHRRVGITVTVYCSATTSTRTTLSCSKVCSSVSSFVFWPCSCSRRTTELYRLKQDLRVGGTPLYESREARLPCRVSALFAALAVEWSGAEASDTHADLPDEKRLVGGGVAHVRPDGLSARALLFGAVELRL